MVRLSRLIPVRVGLIALSFVFVAINSIVGAVGGLPASDVVVAALLGLVATAIAGDTWRPSGVVAGAPSPSPAQQAAIAQIEQLAKKAQRHQEEQARRGAAAVRAVPDGGE